MHRLRLDLGLASALGFGGLSYTGSPVEWLHLEAGVGMGLSGPTLSLMPKIALGSGSDHFVVGLGASLARNRREFTAWLNADVGWEHVFDSGVLIAAALGATGGESSNDLSPWKGHFRRYLPQLRVGFGYAFGFEPPAGERPEAAAPPPSDPSPRTPSGPRRNRIGVDFGVFSAVGLFGVTYGRQLTEVAALEAGVGLGGTGLQLSLMPKVTIGSDGDYYVAGLGVAYAAGMSKTPMFWVNADLVGYERRTASGLAFSVAAGAAACVSGKTTGNLAVGQGVVTPQLRVGGAYWL